MDIIAKIKNNFVMYTFLVISVTFVLVLSFGLSACSSNKELKAKIDNIKTDIQDIDNQPAVTPASVVENNTQPVVIDPNSKKTTKIKVGDHEIEVPEGSSIEYTVEDITTGGKQESINEDKVSGTGSGVETKSDDVAQKTSTSAPTVGLQGVSTASGGELVFSAEMFSGKSGQGVMYVLGALLIVAGFIWMWVTKQIGLGLTISGSGVVLLGIAYISASYPWIWLVGLIVLAGVGIWMLMGAKHKDSLEKSMNSIVSGVERSTEFLRKQFKEVGVTEDNLDKMVEAAKLGIKASIKEQSYSSDRGALVKDMVTRIKAKYGLGNS